MRKLLTLCAYFIAGAFVAGFVSAYAQPSQPDHSDAPAGKARVLAHKCDNNGGVSALLLDVQGSGHVTIQWSNEGICGKSV